MKKAVAAVIEDEKGNVLLTQRGTDTTHEPGKWENCGGSVEEGESDEAAIKREVKEELGVELKVKSILYKGNFISKNEKWNVVIFSGEISGIPKVQNKNENLDVEWFKKSELSGVDLAWYTRKDFIKFGWIDD